jgi:hypothetical protein
MELDAEIQWRVEAMRRQLPSDGYVPFLVATPDAPSGKEAEGRCRSCGVAIPLGPPAFCPDRTTPLVRCDACRHAAWIVVFGSSPSLAADQEANDDGGAA